MNQKEKVFVTIDANEAAQKPKLVETLALHEDVEDYEIKPLSEGDFIIGECMFERKTPSDFASSLQEGRLRDQVERMAGSEMTPFILIEGNMEDYDELEHTDIGSKSLRGMDASIEQRNGISVKYCSNIKLVADEGVRLARKEKEEVTGVQVRQTDAVKDAGFMESVFMAVEGVGPKTAEKLSRTYETLQSALDATEDELQEIESVGPQTAEDVYEELHKDHTEERKSQQKVYTI
jgi:ERCC4-type nuclease